MIDNQALIETCQRLKSAKNILLATHLKPDGDAIGSTLGLAGFLREQNIRCQALLPEGVPELYRLQDGDFLTETPADLQAYDLIVLLDTAVPARAGFAAEGGVPAEIADRLQVIDHHPDNPGFGHWNYLDKRAATAEIVLELCETFAAQTPGAELSGNVADYLLMGLLTDTGGFRFDNTKPEALRSGARLLEAGANLNKVVNLIYFNKPYKQQLFEAELLREHLQWSCENKVAWAIITQELLDKYDFDLSNAEGVIDILRSLSGVEIVALISRRGNGKCRISMRSKNPARPVIDLAHRFNGGGHPMAAGMWVETSDLNEASQIFSDAVQELF